MIPDLLADMRKDVKTAIEQMKKLEKMAGQGSKALTDFTKVLKETNKTLNDFTHQLKIANQNFKQLQQVLQAFLKK